MNSCIFMAEIVQDPQLRYTSDTQTAVTEFLVQIDPIRDGDAPETLKVVTWRKLAEAVPENFHRGDRVVIEGRLGMILFDRPEGFREKRAEVTAQRVHLISHGSGGSAAMTPPPAASMPSPAPVTPMNPEVAGPSGDEPLSDDIPF
ncbi:single-stranded DNA-binding protein [Geitlerinema sp. P-1104]|uniref:single-stranded DNA-binding protein n=1 Tax=Geitlerinema sp. P-1104 TaxID=2546230 RepID=UPI0014776A17|nr:single-stranded DNA-binding protein [Geitlerinema sp. P-1104]NMG61221.1 single-stranded DNA-binding protein [Geitlerinema sp. P-1104]